MSFELPKLFMRRFKARNYNPPAHTAMFLSQWAHQLFVWDLVTYQEYVTLQDLAYRVFPPPKSLSE